MVIQQGRIWQEMMVTTSFCISLRFFLLSLSMSGLVLPLVNNWNGIARIVPEAHRNLTIKCTPCCRGCLALKGTPLQIARRPLSISTVFQHQPASQVPTISFMKTQTSKTIQKNPSITAYAPTAGSTIGFYLDFPWALLIQGKALWIDEKLPRRKEEAGHP